MKAICYDCERLKETRRLMIVRQDAQAVYGNDSWSCLLNLCEDCAIKRGIEEWKTA